MEAVWGLVWGWMWACGCCCFLAPVPAPTLSCWWTTPATATGFCCDASWAATSSCWRASICSIIFSFSTAASFFSASNFSLSCLKLLSCEAMAFLLSSCSSLSPDPPAVKVSSSCWRSFFSSVTFSILCLALLKTDFALVCCSLLFFLNSSISLFFSSAWASSSSSLAWEAASRLVASSSSSLLGLSEPSEAASSAVGTSPLVQSSSSSFSFSSVSLAFSSSSSLTFFSSAWNLDLMVFPICFNWLLLLFNLSESVWSDSIVFFASSSWPAIVRDETLESSNSFLKLLTSSPPALFSSASFFIFAISMLWVLTISSVFFFKPLISLCRLAWIFLAVEFSFFVVASSFNFSCISVAILFFSWCKDVHCCLTASNSFDWLLNFSSTCFFSASRDLTDLVSWASASVNLASSLGLILKLFSTNWSLLFFHFSTSDWRDNFSTTRALTFSSDCFSFSSSGIFRASDSLIVALRLSFSFSNFSFSSLSILLESVTADSVSTFLMRSLCLLADMMELDCEDLSFSSAASLSVNCEDACSSWLWRRADSACISSTRPDKISFSCLRYLIIAISCVLLASSSLILTLLTILESCPWPLVLRPALVMSVSCLLTLSNWLKRFSFWAERTSSCWSTAVFPCFNTFNSVMCFSSKSLTWSSCFFLSKSISALLLVFFSSCFSLLRASMSLACWTISLSYFSWVSLDSLSHFVAFSLASSSATLDVASFAFISSISVKQFLTLSLNSPPLVPASDSRSLNLDFNSLFSISINSTFFSESCFDSSAFLTLVSSCDCSSCMAALLSTILFSAASLIPLYSSPFLLASINCMLTFFNSCLVWAINNSTSLSRFLPASPGWPSMELACLPSPRPASLDSANSKRSVVSFSSIFIVSKVFEIEFSCSKAFFSLTIAASDFSLRFLFAFSQVLTLSLKCSCSVSTLVRSNSTSFSNFSLSDWSFNLPSSSFLWRFIWICCRLASILEVLFFSLRRTSLSASNLPWVERRCLFFIWRLSICSSHLLRLFWQSINSFLKAVTLASCLAVMSWSCLFLSSRAILCFLLLSKLVFMILNFSVLYSSWELNLATLILASWRSSLSFSVISLEILSFSALPYKKKLFSFRKCSKSDQ